MLPKAAADTSTHTVPHRRGERNSMMSGSSKRAVAAGARLVVRKLLDSRHNHYRADSLAQHCTSGICAVKHPNFQQVTAHSFGENPGRSGSAPGSSAKSDENLQHCWHATDR